MQNFVNNYLVDAETKPLLLAISVWLDKAPMNSSMSRSSVPVVIRIMNDLSNTTFVIGYAPNKMPMEEESLYALMRKGKLTTAYSNMTEIIKEAKRFAESSYLSNIFDEFIDKATKNGGVDMQVGYGKTARWYRLFPVLSHFIADNVQSYVNSSVNDHHCRICSTGDFSQFHLPGEMFNYRDWVEQRNICKEYSNLQLIRLKNISKGQNRNSLSKLTRDRLSYVEERKKEIGGLSGDNKMFNLFQFFGTESRGFYFHYLLFNFMIFVNVPMLSYI